MALSPKGYSPNGAPVQTTSTGTADVKTVTPPTTATAFMVSIETNAARVTLDGSAPGATSLLLPTTGSQGLILPIGFPAGGSIKFASSIAANSVVTVQWLN
jgi:hypothetical protein